MNWKWGSYPLFFLEFFFKNFLTKNCRKKYSIVLYNCLSPNYDPSNLVTVSDDSCIFKMKHDVKLWLWWIFIYSYEYFPRPGPPWTSKSSSKSMKKMHQTSKNYQVKEVCTKLKHLLSYSVFQRTEYAKNWFIALANLWLWRGLWGN